MDNGMVFLGMGFELMSVTIGGYFLGDKLDQYFGWHGRLSIALVILLMIGWFIHLFVLLRRFERDAQEAEKHD